MMPLYGDHTCRPIKDNPSVSHLTLADYVKFVEKTLKNLHRQDVLRDEDSCSFIIEELIIRNQRFIPGVISLQTYMRSQIRYALKNRSRIIARNLSKEDRLQEIRCPKSYIDYSINDDPSDDTIKKEEIEIIKTAIPHAKLDQIERQCLYFTLENCNLQQIAAYLDIPACKASRKLKSAQSKIRGTLQRLDGDF